MHFATVKKYIAMKIIKQIIHDESQLFIIMQSVTIKNKVVDL